MLKTPISYLEYQRLELIVPPEVDRNGTSLRARIQRIWQFLMTTSRDSEPRVWCNYDRMGNICWSAFDPVTGRAINQVSESEIRVWIEQRHH